MSKKFKKIAAFTAIAGAIAATVASIFVRFRKNKNTDLKTEDELETESDMEDIDIATINNDIPRQYVSISINAHDKEEQ